MIYPQVTVIGSRPSTSHYLYGLRDPRNKVVRYIGQSCQPPRIRYTQHRYGSARKEFVDWWCDVLNSDKQVEMIIISESRAEEVLGDERLLMLVAERNGHSLLNARSYNRGGLRSTVMCACKKVTWNKEKK